MPAKAYRDLIQLLSLERSPKEWDDMLQDLLTDAERASFAERWQILRLLYAGVPQRDIAERLGVSISKITKGSKVLQQGGRGVRRALAPAKKAPR